MGVNQQQSTDTTAIKGRVVQPLQFDILKQESSSNRTNIDYVEEDRLINVIGIHKDDTVKLHRSKRNIFKTIIDVFRKLGPQRTAELSLLSKEIADIGIDAFHKAKNFLESYFETSDGQVTALSLEELERHVMHNDLSRKLSENYWAIDKSYDLFLGNKGLLLGNQGLLLANQGLLLVNTGLLIGVAFMIMNINSKLDRNYEAILRVETKVDRNYEAILRVENKVDRNLEVMLSRFKILEHNLTNVIERGFKEVIDFVRQTRIEGVTSELITFIRHFIQEKDAIRNLTHDQYVTKLEEVNGILHRLQSSRIPQSGSLHTLLYNIINQRFAIPENSNDRVALTALGLLCAGTETYTSVMSFLLEEYSYLANFYYQQNDLEKYNHYFSLISTTFSDFKNSLAGDNGLINEVISVLNEVKSYDFIKNEREDVVEFASKRIDSLNSVKSKLVTINNLSQEKSTEKIKYNFSNSQVKTPIGNWEDRRKVSYAIQFQSNGTNYQVGEWSTPARVYKKANPLLDIGTDPQGRTRLIFRKFDNDKPELVGIVEDSNKKEFRDISRDFYNAVLEPNEDMAIEEIEVFLENGADIHARYEGGRQAIHAAAESGNPNIMLTLKNRGADINARDTNGYAPIHVAAGVRYENFVKDIVANGADVNAKTSLGRTVLHVAAEKGHVNTITNLMQIEGIDINTKDQRGFTPLHTAAYFGKNNVITSLSQDNRTDINAQSEVGFTPLHLAAIGEYSDAIEALLAGDRVDINAKTQSDLTALHFASLIGDLNIAKLIIGHNKANTNEKSTYGWTPLHLAINSKQESVALELLSADNIEINTKGKDDLTPLHLAASSGQKSIISKLLDKGASIDNVEKYGYTPLHFAIESGDLDVVKCLVEKSANLYAERKDGYTPLCLAAYNGELNIVQFLVNKKGVNVNAENKNGMIPIDFAASKGYFGIVEFLIDKGANKESALHWAAYGGHLNIVRYLADEKHFDSSKKDKYGNIPVHSAALQGHLNIVKYFVDEKQVDLNTENNNGYTPLLFAVLGGNLGIIKYFIYEKNVDFNSSPNKSDNNGSTALHLAALNRNLGVIKYLIRKGANVSAIDNYVNTPLFLATSRGHLDMVKYLIQKGADFRTTNNYGNTLLHFAAWNGHLDVVKYFVEKGVDLNVTNKNGGTPLHVSSSVDITRYLLENGANFRAISKDGYTPMHVAAINGNLDIVKFLIGKGANVHTRIIRSNDEMDNGKAALHLAAQNGELDVVEYLIKEGADVSSRDDSGKTSRDLANQYNHTDVVKFLEEAQLNFNLLNAVKQGNFNKVEEYFDQGATLEVKDKNGDTLQEIATRNGDIEITEFLKQKELNSNLVDAVKQGNLDMVKEYISKGISLEAKDKDGHDLPYLAAQNYDIELFLMQAQRNLDLMNAVKQDNLDMVKYIRKEASLETKDKNGNTLLHLAASSGHLDIAKYLIEEGADFYATNKDSSTSLHTAASNGKLNVVKYLIEEKGANLEVKDKNDNTPLNLAASSGHLDTVKYLVEKGTSLSVTNESGNTPIHEAASLDIVKYLIENGANFNTVNRNGFTLFHVAAANGKLDVVKYLVEEKEASLEVKDDNGNAPTSLAAQNGHLDVVKYLVGKGADTSALGSYLDAVKTIIDERSIDAQDSDGNTSLHLAASSGYLGIVKHLEEKGANLHATNGNSRTPLHVAAEQGYLDIVKYLIGKGADLSTTDNRDVNPLHLAAANGKLDVIKCLVEKGANIHTRMITNNDGKSALHLAVESGNLGSVEYLINEGADLMATNKNGYTPLHYTASLDIIKYIIDKGANLSTLNEYLNIARSIIDKRPINAQDGNGNTSLHLAASNGYLGIVKYLIGKGADLHAINKNGSAPLHLTAQKGHLDIVKYLVEKGANFNAKDTTTTDGKKPIHAAAQGGHKSVIEFLLSKGIGVGDIDKNGWTPLHYTAKYGQLKVAKFLVDKGANVNAKDTTTDGKNPIHIAAQGGHKNVIEFLLSTGVGVNDTDNNGWTPLHYAAFAGQLEVAKFLIDRGANINAKETFTLRLKACSCGGKKPIHVAAQEGHKNIIEFFLSQGVNVDDFANNKWTPLCYAARHGQLEAVEFLVDKGANINARDTADGKKAIHFAAFGGNKNVIRFFLSKGISADDTDYSRWTPLHYAAWAGQLEAVKFLVENGANINIKNDVGSIPGTEYGSTPLREAVGNNRLDVAEYLKSKGARRFRRSIENDDSSIEGNQQATSRESKPFLWVNVFAHTIIDIVTGVSQFISSPFKPAIDIDHSQPSKAITAQSIDTNSTLLLLDVFIRKLTGQKYVSSSARSIPEQEALGYALNIKEEFEKVVEQAGLKSGVSMHRINIDYMGMQKEITRKVIGGKFNEISGVLNSYIEKACPGREAGCAGKLSSKKFDKFMLEFSSLNVVLDQPMQQILHNRLKFGDEQINSGPQSYLSNTSVQGYLTQDKGLRLN